MVRKSLSTRWRRRIIAGDTARNTSVTVLIAAYNAEPFLSRAVSSALDQTLPPKEILIVDDASTDDTVAVARRLARSDARIRVLTLSSNGGPSAARNTGLDVATGEWVAVLDADDAFLPHRLERMLDCAQEVSADLVLDNFCYYNARTKRTGRPVLDEADPDSPIDFADYLSKARPYGSEPDWGLLHPLMRRAFLAKHRLRYPLKIRHGEDFLLVCEAFLHGAKFALCRRAGYLYSSGNSRTLRDYKQMYRQTLQLLQDGRIAQDPKLVHQLQVRAVAVRRLAAEYDFARFRRSGDYNSIVKCALSDNAFRVLLAKRLVRRMLNIPPPG